MLVCYFLLMFTSNFSPGWFWFDLRPVQYFLFPVKFILAYKRRKKLSRREDLLDWSWFEEFSSGGHMEIFTSFNTSWSPPHSSQFGTCGHAPSVAALSPILGSLQLKSMNSLNALSHKLVGLIRREAHSTPHWRQLVAWGAWSLAFNELVVTQRVPVNSKLFGVGAKANWVLPLQILGHGWIMMSRCCVSEEKR